MGRQRSFPEPKIVLLTPYYRPVVGGVTTFVSGLASELLRRGADVTVLTRYGADGPGVLRGPSVVFAFVRWCRRTIREIRPDVVHGHGHWYCLAGALSRFGRPLATRLVFTVHTLPNMPLALRFPFRWLLRRAHVVTFVSDHSRKEFVQRFGPPGESAVVLPGVRDFVVDPREGPRTGPEGFRICAVSLMSWQGKVDGLRLLLEATARLALVLPNVSLTIVGDGEFRPALESLAGRLALAERVRFAGLVDDPTPILSSSDVFCHISFQDAFAQSVLEAMSLSLPVVVNEGTFDDPMFRGPECGIVHSPPDAESLCRVLQTLASEPEERGRLGARAREFVRRELSWRNQAERFWTLYGFASDFVSSP